MKKARDNRIHTQAVAYTTEEWQRLQERFKLSGYKKLIQYIREVSLQRPVKVRYTNASFERFLDEAAELREELRMARERLAPATTVYIKELLDIEEKIKEVLIKIFDLCMQK